MSSASTHRFTSSRFIVTLTQNRAVFWIVLIAVFALARLATWGYPYDSDHWIFYYVGKNWIVDGGDLYVDAWDHKPPLIFFFNGVMAWLFGGDIVWHRIWLTALAVVDAWMFYALAKLTLPSLLSTIKSTINPDVVIKLSLLLYVFLRNLSQFTSSGNNSENYGIIFVIGLLIAYLKFVQTNKWWWLALAGLWVGLLFWLKANFLLFGAIVGVLLLVHGWKNKAKLIGWVAIFIAPIVLMSLDWLIYFWVEGTFDEFVIASFSFSAKYASSAWAGKVSANILLIVTTAALALPALLFFVVGFVRDLRAQARTLAYQLIGLFFVASFVLIIAVGSFYAYYLLIAMPMIALVITYALVRAGEFSRVSRALLVIVFVGTLAVNYAISTRQLLNSFTGAAQQESVYYREAADFVRENTNPNDRVFAYDYGATFYQLAERNSASRYISASHLLLDYRDGFGFGLNETFLREMEDTQAPFVVLNDDSKELYFTNEPVAEYLLEHYEPAKRFGTLEVWQRVR